MKIVKQACFWSGCLLLSVFIGVVCLLAVYALPVGRMKSHVAQSSAIFDAEEAYPELITGYAFTRLDNFTDSIMLSIAMYDGEGSLSEKAMANYRMYSDELGAVKSASHYANDVQSDYYSKPYERYWHGYLVYLKPLLLFFTYGEIRILNAMLQVLLLVVMAKLFLVSEIKEYLPAYGLAFAFVNPAVTSLSLQYSSALYVMIFSVIAWLLMMKKRMLNNKTISFLFFFSGCLVNYIDFLTYPAAALGILLTLYINTYEKNVLKVWSAMKYTLFWIYGYVGMWFGKWVIGSLLLKRSLFTKVLEKLETRTSVSGIEGNGRLAAIAENLNVYNHPPFILLLFLALVLVVAYLCKRKMRVEKKNIVALVAYVIVAVFPFAWMFIASNHSWEHAWFVQRLLSITVLAMVCKWIYLKKNCLSTRDVV